MSRQRVASRYGLTVEEYDEMYASHGGMCSICGRSDKTQKHALHVDHDHKTGAVRGLLCSTCNTGLGHFKDDPELCEAAAKYLRMFAALQRYASKRQEERGTDT